MIYAAQYDLGFFTGLRGEPDDHFGGFFADDDSVDAYCAGYRAGCAVRRDA